MDNVTLGGITYTKLSVLAKKYGYTTDYLGQLCRSDRLDAELVGRAWYANEISLRSHQKERYKNPIANEIVANRKPKNIDIADQNNVIHVQPRLSKRTSRQLYNQQNTLKQHDTTTYLRVSYDSDESELAPTLIKSPNVSASAHKLPVRATTPSFVTTSLTSDSRSYTVEVRDDNSRVQNPKGSEKVPVESRKLNISKQSKAFDLSFTDLASVSLRGSVTIKDLENEDYIDSTTESQPVTKPPRRVTAKMPHQVRVPIQSASKPAVKVTTKLIAPITTNKVSTTSQVTFSPSSVTTKPAIATTLVFYAVPVGFLLVFASVGIILFTGSVYVVEGQTVTSSWYVQMASLWEVFQILQSR